MVLFSEKNYFQSLIYQYHQYTALIWYNHLKKKLCFNLSFATLMKICQKIMPFLDKLALHMNDVIFKWNFNTKKKKTTDHYTSEHLWDLSSKMLVEPLWHSK